MKVKVLWEWKFETCDEEDHYTPFNMLEGLQMHNNVLLMHCELGLWDGKHYGWLASRSMDELKRRVKGPFSRVEVVLDPENEVIYSSEDRIPYKKGDILFHLIHHDGHNIIVIRADTRPCKKYNCKKFLRHFINYSKRAIWC